MIATTPGGRTVPPLRRARTVSSATGMHLHSLSFAHPLPSPDRLTNTNMNSTVPPSSVSRQGSRRTLATAISPSTAANNILSPPSHATYTLASSLYDNHTPATSSLHVFPRLRSD